MYTRKDTDMTAGLPGSGIGGLFYLLTALLMPLHELGMALKGASSPQRRRVVAFQSTIALGIVLMVWATGWALGWLIQAAGQPAFAGNGLPGGGKLPPVDALCRHIDHPGRRDGGGPDLAAGRTRQITGPESESFKQWPGGST
jgi:hypothetical protein